MKKSLLILVTLLIAFNSYSQDSTTSQKQKEIAIGFKSLNSFGLSYKFGKTKSLWRINTIIFSGTNSDENADSLDYHITSFGFIARFGKEYRKSLTDKLEIRYGADLSFNLAQDKYDRDDKSINNNDRKRERNTYTSGFNWVLGFNYLISENLLIGAEILPEITYTTGTERAIADGIETKTDIYETRYGLNNNSALLTLAYRF